MGIIEIIITAGLLAVAVIGIYTLYYIKRETDKCYKEWKQKN